MRIDAGLNGFIDRRRVAKRGGNKSHAVLRVGLASEERVSEQKV